MDVVDIDFLRDPVIITVQCPYCGEKDAIFLSKDNFDKCSCNEEIAKYLSPEDRDLLLRDLCNDCYEKDVPYIRY